MIEGATNSGGEKTGPLPVTGDRPTGTGRVGH